VRRRSWRTSRRPPASLWASPTVRSDANGPDKPMTQSQSQPYQSTVAILLNNPSVYSFSHAGPDLHI
jgi:hypothetical protein